VRGVRGGNYALPMYLMTTRLELDPVRQSIYTGFRCAYPDAGQQ